MSASATRVASVAADTIRAAHARIPVTFRDSPPFVSETLSERFGAPIVVKVETANPIGCFKGRGTWLAVAKLAAAGEVGERHGLLVASAGTFGQGAAYACRALGVPVIVFAARTANPSKLAAMCRLGADVREVGEDLDAARDPRAGRGQCADRQCGRVDAARSLRDPRDRRPGGSGSGNDALLEGPTTDRH